MFIKENLILVGAILSGQGLKGNVVVKSFTSPTVNIIDMQLVNHLEEKIILKLLNQNSKGDLICRFNDINNRTEADALKGLQLFCDRSNFPVLDNEEFYIADLKNLPVVDPQLVPIGKIINIFNFGAGDIIEVKFTLNEKSKLFPFNKQFFPVVTKEYIILNLSSVRESSKAGEAIPGKTIKIR